jgi:ATP-dependent DNA helicase RecG
VKVIEALIKKDSFKVLQITVEINKSAKSIERYIAFLKEIGAVEYEGSKKADGYRVSRNLLKLADID